MMHFINSSDFSDIESNDFKNAGAIQRKIILKGCNKQWLHAIRQIILSSEESPPTDFSEAATES